MRGKNTMSLTNHTVNVKVANKIKCILLKVIKCLALIKFSQATCFPPSTVCIFAFREEKDSEFKNFSSVQR